VPDFTIVFVEPVEGLDGGRIARVVKLSELGASGKKEGDKQ
jgi:hypothetical protein